MTGLRPIHLVRESVAGIRNGINSFREWRLHREMRRADIKGQLAISERELAKQRRSIEKQLKKKGAPVPDRILISPEELAGRPKPKVVDTTALPEGALMAPRKEPSLLNCARQNQNRRSRWLKREDTMPSIMSSPTGTFALRRRDRRF